MTEYFKTIPRVNNNINAVLRSADFTNKFLEITVSNNDLLKYYSQIKDILGNNFNLNHVNDIFKNMNVTVEIDGYELKVNKIILDGSKAKIIADVGNKSVRNFIGRLSEKNSDIVLKATVPPPVNTKPLGTVRFSSSNPFTFPSYLWYDKTTANPAYITPNGLVSLINKGAIFWYNATQVGTNLALGIKYILVNTPLTSFIPNPTTGVVTLANAIFYYGWVNTTNSAYTDFYLWLPTFRNYQYKWSVKNSEFFTTTRFPNTKNIAIK